MDPAPTTQDILDNPLVLVTDDNVQARMLLRRIFEREHYRVEEASDGHEAVQKARELRPDLILMDIQMPGMDGFEAVRLLRSDSVTAYVPIIVVTAAARDPLDVKRGFGMGADDYLVKPFNATELTARAASKIRARRLEDRLQQRTTELEMLVQVGRRLNRALALEDVAQDLLAAVLDYLPARYAALLIIDEHGQPVLTRYIGFPNEPDGLFSRGTLPGDALQRREVITVRDASAQPSGRWILGGVECLSGIALPFEHMGILLGVLVLGDPEPGRFADGQVRVLHSIAEHASLAIRNAQLYTRLQEYVQNLEAMVEARTQALQAAQVQLQRADKLAALGTLAAGIAHEINNPLQPVLTNLELAIEDIDAGQGVDREMLDFARQDVQRIKRIVAGLLDFARPAKMELGPVDVNKVMEEVIGLARKQLEHARVQIQMAPRARKRILGSADQLKQVFLNLVVNAMDAMPGGGILRIETHDRGDFVLLQVQDTGSGIAPDLLPHIFDPFYTTKNHGTGLGLSVSHSIIQSHGGRFEVASEPGQYTRFEVYLPVADK
ncbi:MAG: response regulator [Anaerolineae bacterium]|nr:response regulator [Anaerolineae bacterium]